MKYLKVLSAAAVLVLSACATHPLAQLATACDGLATAVNIAAVHRAQGNLNDGQIRTVLASEPIAKQLCNKDAPPPNVQAALNRVSLALEEITLINAGVVQP